MSNDAAENQNVTIPAPDEPDPKNPSTEWSFRDLEDYIRERLKVGERLDSESLRIGRRSAVEVWYAGKALDIIREKRATKRAWTSWLEDHDLNLDTCYQAIRLYLRAESVDEVRGLTLAEARKKYRTSRGRLWGTPTAEDDGDGGAKKAAKVAPKPKYKETPTLKRLREHIETVAHTVAEADEDDWKNADPDAYLGQIDNLMAKLQQAKQAIRGAQRAAKATLKASSRVNAKATVTSDQQRS